MKQMNETDYQSMDASYYESSGLNPTMKVQRKMDVNLTHYHTNESKTTIKIKDCLTNYEWTGTLEELINQLVRSTKNESMSEL
jgi:hypothetical protein